MDKISFSRLVEKHTLSVCIEGFLSLRRVDRRFSLAKWADLEICEAAVKWSDEENQSEARKIPHQIKRKKVDNSTRRESCVSTGRIFNTF